MFDENGNGAMAMVNHLMNVKDSRWLQVEVCREFQRGQCSREFNECKFAHPPAHVEVQNGRVTACYDSIKKGRCNRENPKCKYLHPPQHIKDQLLINGRNNLALKNLLMNQLSSQGGGYAGAPAALTAVPQQGLHPAANPFLAQQLAAAGAGGQLASMGGLAGYPGAAGGYYAAISPGALYSPQALTAVSLPNASSAASTNSSDPSPSDLSTLAGAGAASVKGRTDRVEALAAVHAAGANQRPPSTGGAGQGFIGPSLGQPLAQPSPASGIGKKRRLDETSPSPSLHSSIASSMGLGAGAAYSLASSAQLGLATGSAQPLFSQASASSAAASQAHAQAQALQQHQLMALLQAQAQAQAGLALSQSGQPQAQGLPGAAVLQAQAQAQGLQGLPAGYPAPAAQDPAASHQQLLLAAALQQQSAMNAQKRLALEAKSGVPVYQPQGMDPNAGSAASYAAAYAAAGQQQFAPQHFAQGYIPALALGGGVGLAAATTGLPPNANNTASVAYFDESGQLLDTLPVCRDFKQAHCERPSCRYVHLLEDYVEVMEGKVTVCRDYAKGKCSRVACKYYHVPILHPAHSALLLAQPSTAALSLSSPNPALFSLPLQPV